MKYSKMTGVIKTLKNIAITWAIPALLYTLANIGDVVPDNWLPVAMPISAALSYFVKNAVENGAFK